MTNRNCEEHPNTIKVEGLLKKSGIEILTKKQLMTKNKYTIRYGNHESHIEIQLPVVDPQWEADRLIKNEVMIEKLAQLENKNQQ